MHRTVARRSGMDWCERRHGAGLRKIAAAGLATLAILVTNILTLQLCWTTLHCTIYIFSGYHHVLPLLCLLPVPCLDQRAVDSRKISLSSRSWPEAGRRQSLPIHHLTSYHMHSSPWEEIFDCIQFEIIAQQEICWNTAHIKFSYIFVWQCELYTLPVLSL